MKLTSIRKANFYLKFFSISKIPLLWYCRPKIVSLNSDYIEIKIPLRRRTKNHLNSMYFGALSVGADITGGFFAMMCIQQSKRPLPLKCSQNLLYNLVVSPIYKKSSLHFNIYIQCINTFLYYIFKF